VYGTHVDAPRCSAMTYASVSFANVGIDAPAARSAGVTSEPVCTAQDGPHAFRRLRTCALNAEVSALVQTQATMGRSPTSHSTAVAFVRRA
jgi:hypothetical protein